MGNLWWRSQNPKNNNPSCPDCDPGKWGAPVLQDCDREGYYFCQSCQNYKQKNKTIVETPTEKKPGGIHHVPGIPNIPKHAPKGIPVPPQKSGAVIVDYRNKNPRRNSINSCLVVLGAAHSDVYHKPSNGNRINGKSYKTIYERYTKAEIYHWAKHLKRKSLEKYHPDKNLFNEKWCTQKCKEINEAFETIKKILRLK